MKFSFSAAALLGVMAHLATAQVAILHIRVVEGEGAVSAAGSHLSRPLTVEVTDETGRPVEGASVSFHLPDAGPGGTFGNGLRTDVTVTDARGRASLHTILLNRAPGRFAIRIVASKEQARAGLMTFQYVAEPKGASETAAGSKSRHSLLRGPLKWAALAAMAGGAATAGALLSGKSATAAASPSAPSTGPSTTPGVTIGSPSISVGKP